MSNSSFIERLKQSRVFQAVGVYLGASWAVLGGADLLESQLGLPDWVAVALVCYAAAAVCNALAWLLTDVPDGDASGGDT